MNVRLIAITQYNDGNVEDLIEHAGRVCYHSQTTSQKQNRLNKFVMDRIKVGHESIVEHASATFEISGISRAASHQIVRHRIASFSEISQRYVDMSNPEYVIPDSIRNVPAAMQVWDDLMSEVESTYQALRSYNIPKEDARFILPNATVTHMIVTMNFRELLHLFTIRISREAQWEIRNVCVAMLKLVYQVAPSVFDIIYDEKYALYPDYFEVGS